MIAFSIMMWFVSIIFVVLSISLLRGNYSSVHGKVLDSTEDKEEYAKALGRPVFFLGVGFAVVGITAVVLPQKYSILISVAFFMKAMSKTPPAYSITNIRCFKST